MSKRLVQTLEQKQEQKLTQSITQQQLLQAKLVELPIAQLLDRIKTEMHDNPALERSADITDTNDYPDSAESLDTYDSADDYETQREREERQDALDIALENIGRDDEELPIYTGNSNHSDEQGEIVYGEHVSFHDQLKEQMGFARLTEQEHDIMEYLIGSLDDDGLLRKPLDVIVEELAIYSNVNVTEQEVERVLDKLQQFDPAGIGARSLQECLLLQIERRDDSQLKTLMMRVVTDYFDAFTKMHWDKIKTALKLNDVQADALFGLLRRLNPKPGASMNETAGDSTMQITPDFIVDTHDDGTVTFILNQGDLPELQVSQSFADSMKEYQENGKNMTRQTKEALLYIKKKVDSARNFIEAIRMRRHTLTVTMKAIIQLQHQFFLDGDETSLHPMKLLDVAERTGLGVSTISRVSNSKYAQTRWGTFPLRYFFSDSYTTEQGEELSTRQVKAALRDIIESENPNKPLTDETLAKQMVARGYDIARRTVTKYREQMGIPVARLRKPRK